MRIALLSFVLILSGCGGGGGGTAQAADAVPEVYVIRDSGDRILGLLLEPGPVVPPSALLTINGDPTILHLEDTPLRLITDGVYFTTADCTGTAYSTATQRLANELAGKASGRWYVAPHNATQTVIHVLSYWHPVLDSCAALDSTGFEAFEAVQLSVSQTTALDAYTPPYEIGLAPVSSLPGI